ncbi:MAG: hypothetical protein QM758_24575 [Armatimonas sp.]
MQKNLVVSLVPIVLLLGTALSLRVENSAEPPPPKNNDAEITRALKSMTQEAPSLKPELKQALLRYRGLKGEAREAATHKRAWNEWQDPVVRAITEERLSKLAGWDNFSLETPLRRASGQVEVVLVHENERLKAWFVKDTEGWKLSGIVVPPQPYVLR